MFQPFRSFPRSGFGLLAAALGLVAGCSGDVGDVGDGGGPVAVVDDDSTYRYRCDLVFAVGGPPATFEEVAVAVTFAKSLGTFLLDSRGARCESDLASVATGEQEHNNNDPSWPEALQRNFYLTLDDVEGLALPAEVATCVFLAKDEPVLEDFSLDAFVWQPTGSTVMPGYSDRPKASAVLVDCVEISTLPESTTTTTLDECAAIDCGPGESCRAGACRELETGRLEIYLDSAAEAVGSVQLQIDYAGSGASFTHEAGKRACVPNPDANGWLYSDCDFRPGSAGLCEVSPGFHAGELGLGIVTLQPMTAPVLLASCHIAAEDLDEAVAAMRLEFVHVTSDDIELIDGQLSLRLVRD